MMVTCTCCRSRSPRVASRTATGSWTARGRAEALAGRGRRVEGVAGAVVEGADMGLASCLRNRTDVLLQDGAQEGRNVPVQGAGGESDCKMTADLTANCSQSGWE